MELYRSKNFALIVTLSDDIEENSLSVTRDSKSRSNPAEHREYTR